MKEPHESESPTRRGTGNWMRRLISCLHMPECKYTHDIVRYTNICLCEFRWSVYNFLFLALMSYTHHTARIGVNFQTADLSINNFTPWLRSGSNSATGDPRRSEATAGLVIIMEYLQTLALAVSGPGIYRWCHSPMPPSTQALQSLPMPSTDVRRCTKGASRLRQAAGRSCVYRSS